MKKSTKLILILILSSIVMTSCSQTIDLEKDKKDINYNFTNGILKYKSKPFTGKVESHYQNGQLQSKGSFKEGEKDGVWEIYFEDGKLSKKESYVKGYKDEGLEQVGSPFKKNN